MMKRIVIACCLLLFASIANAGSLTLTYKNTAGTTTLAPTATISDTDASTFLTWCSAHYSATPGSGTSAGCFNIYADDLFNQLKLNIQATAAAAAAATAAAGVTPITIAPAQ